MDNGRRLGAGIIGPSGIGRVHTDAIRRIGADVVALVASTPGRGGQLATELRVPVACESVEDLVARSDVHVVHICTPNTLHAEQVEIAIEAGKHVVCEKPLATSAGEAQALLEHAEAKGIIHAVAYCYRFYPMLQAMRADVRAGRLGRIHLLRGAYLFDEVLLIDDGQSWMLEPSLMGPALSLADVGVHWWDLAEHISGQRVKSVICTCQAARDPQAPGEDSAAIMLQMDGGAVASAVISSAAPGHANSIELEVVGTQASTWWAQDDNPDRLSFGELGRPVELRMRSAKPEGVRLPATIQVPRGHPQGYLDAFRDLIASVYEAIDGSDDAPEFPTFADGVRGVRILEALLESADTETWVTVR